MIQLTAAEWVALRSQIVTLKSGRGRHRKYLPYAFTEQGVAMLSSVLNSDRAIAVNIEIMRAFVKLCELLVSNKELARRFAQLETRLDKKLTEQDRAIGAIRSAIRELIHPKVPVPKRRAIGFTADLDVKSYIGHVSAEDGAMWAPGFAVESGKERTEGSKRPTSRYTLTGAAPHRLREFLKTL